MFFATTNPANLRRHLHSPSGRTLEHFLADAPFVSRENSGAVKQDETSYTLTFDLPGIAKEQLHIGLEGSVVRIQSKEGASRQYRQAYELPQDIDTGNSEAKLENGVLTLKLGKLVPPNRVTELPIH